jgi:hypothetical protein
MTQLEGIFLILSKILLKILRFSSSRSMKSRRNLKRTKYPSSKVWKTSIDRPNQSIESQGRCRRLIEPQQCLVVKRFWGANSRKQKRWSEACVLDFQTNESSNKWLADWTPKPNRVCANFGQTDADEENVFRWIYCEKGLNQINRLSIPRIGVRYPKLLPEQIRKAVPQKTHCRTPTLPET